MAEHSHHTPGELPDVRDEAPPTATWVPLLGLGLLAVLLLFVVYRAANPPEEPEGEAIAGEIAGTPAAEAGEGAAPAPAQPAAAAQPAAPSMPQIVPVPTERVAPAQLGAQPPQPAQPAAQPAQPAAPAGGPDAFGRQPGHEHYGHGHE